MSELPFQIIKFTGDVEDSRSFSPTEKVARDVAKWWCDRSGDNRAAIRNTKTGHVEPFRREGADVISEESGEVLDECPGCAKLRVENDGKQRDIKAWQGRYAQLAAKIKKKAVDEGHWQLANEVFEFWQIQCKHPNSKFDIDVFEFIYPLVDRYGLEKCYRAVRGAAYDPYITTNKNGKQVRHDGIDLIFRNGPKLEYYVNKAELPWRPELYMKKPQR